MGLAATAGFVFALITAVVVGFQSALALGAPWGGGERRIWAPTVVIMLACCLVVAVLG